MVFGDVPNRQYRSEIHFLSCFIAHLSHFVNSLIAVGRLIAHWPEILEEAGCSLFARF